VHYEDHCAAHHDAATLTGFLFWLENPSSPELDLQPVVTSGNAVHVLTYHKAKGLEWPVVIAADLNYQSPSTIFDVRVQLTAEFDVNQPLANRTIRLWPNVFGKKTRNIPPLDRILNSQEGRGWAAKNASEDRRLAYVGLTRARDLLALAAPGRRSMGAWLDCFDGGFTVPQGDDHPLPNGQIVPTRAVPLDGNADQIDPSPYAPRWFVQRERRQDLVKALVNPSSAPPLQTAQVTETIELGDRLPLRGEDMTAIGSALHAIIAAELVNPDQPDAKERAEEVLKAYHVQGFIDSEDALNAARRLRSALVNRFNATKITAECPIQHVLDDGQVVRGFIDLLIVTPQGQVVIDHKSSPKPRSQWSKEVIEHGGQLKMYELAVLAATGQTPRLALHFPVSGGLVTLSIHGRR
jgi:ATP-dependent exoDNAse (exonuclease V) beta subunit